jgi:hypothetical protein
MRKTTLALAFGILVLAAAAPQAPQRTLSDADVRKFVSDFKAMAAELEQIGETAHLDEENSAGLGNMLAGLQASSAAQGVLRKYGWADSRFSKLSAVFFGYLAIKLEQWRLESGGELDAAIAEIDRNPQLPPDQKAALKAQFSGMRQAMIDSEQSYRAQVHPADIETVRANKAALDAMFEE